jgi:hypothetical protein
MTKPIQIMPRPNLTIEERARLIVAVEKASKDARLSPETRVERARLAKQLRTIQARRGN